MASVFAWGNLALLRLLFGCKGESLRPGSVRAEAQAGEVSRGDSFGESPLGAAHTDLLSSFTAKDMFLQGLGAADLSLGEQFLAPAATGHCSEPNSNNPGFSSPPASAPPIFPWAIFLLEWDAPFLWRVSCPLRA